MAHPGVASVGQELTWGHNNASGYVSLPQTGEHPC